MSEVNIEHKTWFTNRQVLSLLGFAIFATYFTTQYLLTSDDNDERIDDVELEMEEMEAAHDKDIKDIEKDMKDGYMFLQDQRKTDKEESQRRTNTIRDRHDERLKELEKSGSDKN